MFVGRRSFLITQTLAPNIPTLRRLSRKAGVATVNDFRALLLHDRCVLVWNSSPRGSCMLPTGDFGGPAGAPFFTGITKAQGQAFTRSA
jgi:hypothetical protein